MALNERARPERARVGHDPDHNRGFITQSVVLGSHSAQIIFAQTYERTESALYSLGVVMRNIAPDKSEADKVLDAVDKRLVENGKEVSDEIKRLDVLLKSQGIREQVQYSAPQTISAQISSPQAARFLALIHDVDKIISRMTLLWVHGVVSNQELGKVDRRWVANYRRWSLQLRTINRSALRAANIKRQEVRVEESRIADARVKKAQASAEKKASAAQRGKSNAKPSKTPKKEDPAIETSLTNMDEAKMRVDLKTKGSSKKRDDTKHAEAKVETVSIEHLEIHEIHVLTPETFQDTLTSSPL